MRNQDFDLAEIRADQEREAGIAAARSAIGGRGRPFCDCGEAISDYRREQFGAVRCLECQAFFEAEKYHK